MLPIKYLYIRLQEKITKNRNATEQTIVSLNPFTAAVLYIVPTKCGPILRVYYI